MQQRKQEILSTPNTIKPTGTNTVYYISNSGDDDNPGTIEKPWKSIQKLNDFGFRYGDTVLFQRGNLWRGGLRAKEGVTYSAYGEGNKPKLYSSPENAASADKWEHIEGSNLYRYRTPLKQDVGTLVFNEGETHAIKTIIRTEKDGSTFDNTTGKPFKTEQDLEDDLHFYHDYSKSGNLYLYSAKGNPGTRFKSIEINIKQHIVTICGNGITIDNLCLKYGGSHGIGSGSTINLTVSNCELGWIGGSIQAEGIYGRNHATRYGNAVEIWGTCSNYTVTNCYIYQVYDAAVTHQFYPEKLPIRMNNVKYQNNVMENCDYSIEYFLSKVKPGDDAEMKGFIIENNIMANAGYGFCEQRPDKTEAAHIKSWNHSNPTKDFIVRNNIFLKSKNMLLHIHSVFPDSMPNMEGNTYIQTEGGLLGIFGVNAPDRKPFNESTLEILQDKTQKSWYLSNPKN